MNTFSLKNINNILFIFTQFQIQQCQQHPESSADGSFLQFINLFVKKDILVFM